VRAAKVQGAQGHGPGSAPARSARGRRRLVDRRRFAAAARGWDFVEIAGTSSIRTLKIDADGTGTAHGWVQIGTITTITGANDINDEALLRTNGNLIAA
jgi:hypothetical protein